MVIAALVMMGIALLLGGMCLARGGTALLMEGVRTGARGMLPLFPMLVVMLLLTGFAEVLLPRATVSQWLSDSSGWSGLSLAWVAGVLTPGGGPIGLPLAAALMRSGAGLGVLVTYLTSMSLLSFVRMPLEIGFYGMRLTAVRVATCVVLPFLAGLLAQVIGRFVGFPG